MDIRLIKGSEIDKVKWNSCVHYAGNGNIFGYMWFLDQVAKDWHALVEGDYESVFPLPFQSGRWQGTSLKQPTLMRELGLFSVNVLSRKRMTAFLEAIPEEFKKVDLVLNEQNPPLPETGFEFVEETNHQLVIPETYEVGVDQYSRELMLDLDKAVQAELIPVSGLSPEKLIAFFRKERANYPGKTADSHALLRIMYNCLHRGWGFASGIQDREENLLAVNFFVYSHSKVLSLLPVESRAGKAQGALAYLFDLILQSHAGRPLILDFNSDDPNGPGAAFGATANRYYRIIRKSKSWF
ncbi:MAG: hypothetical protein KDC34_10805 [Saprospiraceae bacterium]|nr:hypothetical protein [Saprospiraceae bacterium]